MTPLSDKGPMDAIVDIAEGAAATSYLYKATSGDPRHVDHQSSKGRILPTVKVRSHAQWAIAAVGQIAIVRFLWPVLAIFIKPLLVLSIAISAFPILYLEQRSTGAIGTGGKALAAISIAILFLATTSIFRFARTKHGWWFWAISLVGLAITEYSFFHGVSNPDYSSDSDPYHMLIPMLIMLPWSALLFFRGFVWYASKWVLKHDPKLTYADGYSGPFGRHQPRATPQQASHQPDRIASAWQQIPRHSSDT